MTKKETSKSEYQDTGRKNISTSGYQEKAIKTRYSGTLITYPLIR